MWQFWLLGTFSADSPLIDPLLDLQIITLWEIYKSRLHWIETLWNFLGRARGCSTDWILRTVQWHLLLPLYGLLLNYWKLWLWPNSRIVRRSFNCKFYNSYFLLHFADNPTTDPFSHFIALEGNTDIAMLLHMWHTNLNSSSEYAVLLNPKVK